MRGRIAHGLRIVTIWGLVALAWLVLRGWVGAQDSPRRALPLAVAQVAANEAGLREEPTRDVALIWQVTRSRARTVRGRLQWLRAHSSCVLTDRAFEGREVYTNCSWTRYLTDSNREPRYWPSSWPRWAPTYARRWAVLRQRAWELVSGRRSDEPCEGVPFSWGSRQDHPRAIERGLVLLESEGTLNGCYGLAALNGGES